MLLFCLFLLPSFLVAGDYELGSKLTHRLWNDIKKHHIHAIKQYISPAFQESIPSLQLRRSAKQEIEVIKQLQILQYSIHSIRTKRQGNALIVTYFIGTTTLENNQTVFSSPSVRLTVWEKVNGLWVWVAHQGGI